MEETRWQRQKSHPILISFAIRRSSPASRRIVGTRIAVRNIIEAARDTQSVEDLYSDYLTATREAIEEALAFYADNRDEIEAYIAENEAAMTSDIR